MSNTTNTTASKNPSQQTQTQPSAPRPSPPSHMMTHDIKTKDGLIYPNRVGPANIDKNGEVKGKIEMAPLNGDVTTQTYERYIEKMRAFRQGKRDLYLAQQNHEQGHSRE